MTKKKKLFDKESINSFDSWLTYYLEKARNRSRRYTYGLDDSNIDNPEYIPDIDTTPENERNTFKYFLDLFLQEVFFIYYQFVIGLRETVIDFGAVYDRNALFGQVEQYGGEIPFIGMTKRYHRRHYRNWMTLEDPYIRKIKNESVFYSEFYMGGYLLGFELLLFDIDTEHFTLPGEFGCEYLVRYLSEPKDYIKPKKLTKEEQELAYFEENAAVFVDLLERQRFLCAVWWCQWMYWKYKGRGDIPPIWDMSSRFLELYDFFFSPLEDYGYEEGEDGELGSYIYCYSLGGFFGYLYYLDTVGDVLFTLIYIKFTILVCFVLLGTLLDQGLACYGWYTIFKDYSSLFRTRIGFFSYYRIFCAMFFAVTFPKFYHWYIVFVSKPVTYYLREVLFYHLWCTGNTRYKKLQYQLYFTEAWWWGYHLGGQADIFYQDWYNFWNHAHYAGKLGRTWFTIRRIDMIYFNAQLKRYPFTNTLDFYHPPYSHCGQYWIYDRRAIWYWGPRDFLAGAEHCSWNINHPKTRKWIGDNMTPLWFTVTRAPWLHEPTFYYDAACSCQVGFQDPSTPIMEGIIDLHHDLFFFFIVIGSLVFWLLFRILFFFSMEAYVTPLNFYRNLTHHTMAEVIWTILPALILVLIATPSFSLLYAMEDIIKPSLTVKVIGNQWYWTYEYVIRSYHDPLSYDLIDPLEYNIREATKPAPIEKIFDSYMIATEDLYDGEFRLLEVDRRLMVPTFAHIRFLITSSDVLHSFAVPSLGIKLDACPGRLNQVTAFIMREGIFYGQCSELCGINHAFMPIVIEAYDLETIGFWMFNK